MARLKRTNLTARPKKPHACGSCDKSYTTATRLRRHRNSHTQQFKCTTCSQRFSSSYDLNRHRKAHPNEKPDIYWVCPCDKDKQWPRKDNFKAHLGRKHPDENNPAFIQQCERRRDVVEDSGQNQVTHQGEKPSHANNHGSPADVQLNFENRGLYDPPEWLHDKSSHDTMKSIKNVIKSAPQKGLEQRQSSRALENKPIHCTECDKTYNRPCDLNKHIRKKHEKPWHCTHSCNRRFGAKHYWEKHERKKHPQRMSGSHFWCGFCGKYVQSQPMQDCLKSLYDHLGDHFLGHTEPSDFSMFKFEPQQTQVGHNGTVTTSEGSMELDTPPRPAPDARRITDSTLLNNDKIEKMSVLAKRAITRLESAQARPYRRAAAQAAAANLRLRKNAEDAKMYAGVKYARKTQGLFTGKFVSQGTIIDIDGEYYIECGVLMKPLPP